jgi:hypothetical protein
VPCDRDNERDDAVRGEIDVADAAPGFAENIGELEVDPFAVSQQVLAVPAREGREQPVFREGGAQRGHSGSPIVDAEVNRRHEES